MNKSGFSISFDLKRLEKLQKNVKKLGEQKEVALNQLLPDAFVQAHTNFKTLQEMIDASGIKKPEEMDGEPFSQFIATHSSFGSWKEMGGKATAEYIKRKIGL